MVRIGTAGWVIPRQSAEIAAGEGSHLERYARVMKTVSRSRGLGEAPGMPFSLIENGASLVCPGDSDRETVRGCVEVNSSFHRAHRSATWARWAEAVPEDFRVSVKFPKAVTHEAKAGKD